MAASAGKRNLGATMEEALEEQHLGAEMMKQREETRHGDDSPQDKVLSKLDSLFHEIQALRTEVSDFSTKLTNAVSDFDDQKQTVKALQDQNVAMEKELQQVKNELAVTKSLSAKLQKKVNDLDAYNRRDNLIFYGLPETKDENCTVKIKAVINTNMGISDVQSIKFDKCHRLINSNVRPKPITCRFNWYADRDKVWKARLNLKGSSISVSEDFPPETVHQRKALYPIMLKAKQLGKKSYLVAEKLVIDDRTYTIHNLHALPKELDPALIATKTVGDVTAFCSAASPLSNFYGAKITVKDKTYEHVEQCLQYQKAMFGGRPDVAQKIAQTTSPVECKVLGDSVEVNRDQWLPNAKDILMQACKLKFEQNERAGQFLKQTGTKILAEATKDQYWGIGMTLKSPNLDDQSAWGKNEMGKILMHIRDNELA